MSPPRCPSLHQERAWLFLLRRSCLLLLLQRGLLQAHHHRLALKFGGVAACCYHCDYWHCHYHYIWWIYHFMLLLLWVLDYYHDIWWLSVWQSFAIHHNWWSVTVHVAPYFWGLRLKEHLVVFFPWSWRHWIKARQFCLGTFQFFRIHVSAWLHCQYPISFHSNSFHVISYNMV